MVPMAEAVGRGRGSRGWRTSTSPVDRGRSSGGAARSMIRWWCGGFHQPWRGSPSPTVRRLHSCPDPAGGPPPIPPHDRIWSSREEQWRGHADLL
jgi:hypothetical protein